MKKTIIFSFIIGIFSLLSFQFVYADILYRIQIDEVINRRNILITHPETNEKYLLRLKSGCGDIQTNQNVFLSIRGALDSSNDIIKEDAWHQCGIDWAEKFTQKLYVEHVSHGNQARIADELGQKYFITYTDACRAMPSYRDTYIYVLQGANYLRQGDKIFLLNYDGQCSISYVRKVETDVTEIPEEPVGDTRVPTSVVRVKAFPMNGKVFLSWSAARDNVGISHYIVSYNTYKIRTKGIPIQEMPNQIQTEDTHLTVENLENEETYYFYVLAVDTSGNVSSRWSMAAKATPKSSILSDELTPSGTYSLNVRIANESPRSFLIRWNHHPMVTRYSVIFEVDGQRVFTRTGYTKRYIRILKKESREGKPLTLKVRSYGLRGFLREAEVNFEF